MINARCKKQKAKCVKNRKDLKYFIKLRDFGKIELTHESSSSCDAPSSHTTESSCQDKSSSSCDGEGEGDGDANEGSCSGSKNEDKSSCGGDEQDGLNKQ